MNVFSTLLTTLTLCALGLGTASHAQSPEPYPTRPLKMVVPFGPGSGTDTVARVGGDSFALLVTHLDAVPELAEQALRNGGPRSDNVTVLAVEWEGAEEASSPPAVLTRSLGDEVFASTIQASLAGSDLPADELDEAEIDRSIREINEAIKRSSQKKPDRKSVV